MTSLTENVGDHALLAFFKLIVNRCSSRGYTLLPLACLSASYHCQGIARESKMFMQGGNNFGCAGV